MTQLSNSVANAVFVRRNNMLLHCNLNVAICGSTRRPRAQGTLASMISILVDQLLAFAQRRSPWPRSGRRGSNTGKRINLALQGGGAHGAFTWGVLDHLLADGRFAIGGISGASAGAVNAVMLADGLTRGGTAGGARAARGVLARGEHRRPVARPAARAWRSGCSRSCRATAPGSARCRGCGRPTISTRSTSIRSRT